MKGFCEAAICLSQQGHERLWHIIRKMHDDLTPQERHDLMVLLENPDETRKAKNLDLLMLWARRFDGKDVDEIVGLDIFNDMVIPVLEKTAHNEFLFCRTGDGQDYLECIGGYFQNSFELYVRAEITYN